tara:strand:+ start:84 stop:491 length:408 start_codon:yes stop_codon:yes gene_type:complete
MSNYNNKTQFEFQIERLKDKDGKFIEEGKFPVNFNESDFEYETISIQINGRAFFQSGNFSGLPENCYPDESEVEILSALGPNKEDWLDKLSSSEYLDIISIIEEKCSSDDSDDDHDDYDYDYDYEQDYADDHEII